MQRNLAANPASVAWGTANNIVYVPFYLPRGETVVKLWTYNGSTAAGNTDIGIFTRAGVKLVSSGANGTVWYECVPRVQYHRHVSCSGSVLVRSFEYDYDRYVLWLFVSSICQTLGSTV